jgi:hypothetical protein
LATLAATTVSPFDDLHPAIKAAQDPDPPATDMRNKIVHPGLPNGQAGSMDKKADMQWKVIAGALNFKERIYVPETLHNEVISHFHESRVRPQ